MAQERGATPANSSTIINRTETPEWDVEYEAATTVGSRIPEKLNEGNQRNRRQLYEPVEGKQRLFFQFPEQFELEDYDKIDDSLITEEATRGGAEC